MRVRLPDVTVQPAVRTNVQRSPWPCMVLPQSPSEVPLGGVGAKQSFLHVCMCSSLSWQVVSPCVVYPEAVSHVIWHACPDGSIEAHVPIAPFEGAVMEQSHGP